MHLIASLTGSNEILWPLIELMETREWDVFVCADLGRALRRLRDDPPDLIVVDDCLALSEAGRAFVRRLHECPQLEDIPVLVVCVLADPGNLEDGFSLDGYAASCDAHDWDHLVSAVEHTVAKDAALKMERKRVSSPGTAR